MQNLRSIKIPVTAFRLGWACLLFPIHPILQHVLEVGPRRAPMVSGLIMMECGWMIFGPMSSEVSGRPVATKTSSSLLEYP